MKQRRSGSFERPNTSSNSTQQRAWEHLWTLAANFFFSVGENVWLHSSPWTCAGRIRNVPLGCRQQNPEAWGERLVEAPLLSRRGHDSRREPQRKMKIKNWDILLLCLESEHLSAAIERHYLPRGATYINQSDKRDTLTAFLSLRLSIPRKELLLTRILNGCYYEEWLS